MPTETYDNDDFLIKMLATDTRQAITILYNTYHSDLLEITVAITHNKAVAKDIVQDLYYTLWERRYSVKVTKPIKSYLVKSVLNRCRNFSRDSARTRILPLPHADSTIEINLGMTEPLMEIEELKKLADSVVSGFPPKRKVAYILSRKLKMSHSEIAGHLGISEKTVQKHIFKALHTLRSLLSGYLKMLALFLLTWQNF